MTQANFSCYFAAYFSAPPCSGFIYSRLSRALATPQAGFWKMWDTAAWSLAFLNVSSAEGSPRRLAVPGREPSVYLLYAAAMKRKQRCLSSVFRRKVGVSDPAGQFTPEKDPARMMWESSESGGAAVYGRHKFLLVETISSLARLTPTGGAFRAAWFFLAGFLLSIHYPAASLPSLARLSSADPGYCFQSFPPAFLFPACFCPFPDSSLAPFPAPWMSFCKQEAEMEADAARGRELTGPSRRSQ